MVQESQRIPRPGSSENGARPSCPNAPRARSTFIDLCCLLGQPTPTEHDATGAEYSFETLVGRNVPLMRGGFAPTIASGADKAARAVLVEMLETYKGRVYGAKRS